MIELLRDLGLVVILDMVIVLAILGGALLSIIFWPKDDL
jgi:hypothetical protein